MSKRIIKGDELQLFLNDSAPLYATSHTITVTGSTIDTATKDHGYFGSTEVGKLSWELTAECLYSDDQYDMMFDMMIRRTKTLVKFAKVKNYSVNGLINVGGDTAAWIPDEHAFTGYATVTSLTANANTGENATYSITFTGAGPLTLVDDSETLNFITVHYGPMEAGETYTLWNLSSGISGARGTAISISDRDDVSLNSRQNTYTPADDLTSLELIIYFTGTVVPASLLFENENVTYVEVGSTITDLGSAAFSNCTNLEAAVLNANVGLAPRLFNGDSSLEELTLPEIHGNESDGYTGVVYNSYSSALSGCNALTTIYVPSELVSWYENTAPWSNLTVEAIS